MAFCTVSRELHIQADCWLWICPACEDTSCEDRGHLNFRQNGQLIYDIYWLIVTSQLGGSGGLCDCAVVLKFHAFDWRPTTESTKFMRLARFSQVAGMPEKPWLEMSMFKQSIGCCWDEQKHKSNTNKTQTSEENREQHKETTPKQHMNTNSTNTSRMQNEFAVSNFTKCAVFGKINIRKNAKGLNSQHQGAHPILTCTKPSRSKSWFCRMKSSHHINFRWFQFLHTDYIDLQSHPSISIVLFRLSRHGANSATCSTKVDQRRPPLKSSATHAASASASPKSFESETCNSHLRQKLWSSFSKNGKKSTGQVTGKNFMLRQTGGKRLARHGTWLWSSSNSLPMANPMTCLGPTMARNSFVQPDLKNFKFLKDWKVVGVFAKAGTPSLFIITFQARHGSPNQDLNTSAMPRCETAVMFRISCRILRNLPELLLGSKPFAFLRLVNCKNKYRNKDPQREEKSFGLCGWQAFKTWVKRLNKKSHYTHHWHSQPCQASQISPSLPRPHGDLVVAEHRRCFQQRTTKGGCLTNMKCKNCVLKQWGKARRIPERLDSTAGSNEKFHTLSLVICRDRGKFNYARGMHQGCNSKNAKRNPMSLILN